MSEISADKVRDLREKSGAGIMDCKRALAQSEGDLDKAIEFLRKEGVVRAAKKAGRTTLEGLIGISPSEGGPGATASMIELNCETDFVARTDVFQEFLASVAAAAAKNRTKDLSQLLTVPVPQAKSVHEALSGIIARLGENMTIRRFHLMNPGEDEVIGSYLHAGSKIGVLVRLQGNPKGMECARDVAMHVAAMSPQYIDRTCVPAEIILREREIIEASPDVLSKPEVIRGKIAEGRLGRFYSENCLLEQSFIKDPTGKKTMADYMKEKAPGARVAEVVRFQVGEEIH